MRAFPKLLTIAFLLTAITANGQDRNVSALLPDSATILFRDTLFNIAFDSITHNLGLIKPANEHNRLVKYFKYVGADTIFITRTWTEDPHYICIYPKEPLVPNKIYAFTVCFWHEGKKGRMSKAMGFLLSNGNSVMLRFTGEYAQ